MVGPPCADWWVPRRELSRLTSMPCADTEMPMDEVLPIMVQHVLSAFQGDRRFTDAEVAAALKLFQDVRAHCRSSRCALVCDATGAARPHMACARLSNHNCVY